MCDTGEAPLAQKCFSCSETGFFKTENMGRREVYYDITKIRKEKVSNNSNSLQVLR